MTLTGKAAKKRRGVERTEEIELYRAATESAVDDYLAINARSEPERVARIRTAAEDRRARRKAKHKPKVFQIDLTKERVDLSMPAPPRIAKEFIYGEEWNAFKKI